MARQQVAHRSSFDVDRDGIRLGLATIEDELKEALDAWRAGYRHGKFFGTPNWEPTAKEVLQIAGNAMRLYTSIVTHKEVMGE